MNAGQWLVWLQVHFFNMFVSMLVGKSASYTRHFLSQRLFVNIFNFRVSHSERITIMKRQCIVVIVASISSTPTWAVGFFFLWRMLCVLYLEKRGNTHGMCAERCVGSKYMGCCGEFGESIEGSGHDGWVTALLVCRHGYLSQQGIPCTYHTQHITSNTRQCSTSGWCNDLNLSKKLYSRHRFE